MVDLAFAPAHELAAAVRRRELSPLELVTATLERVARLNPVLNAFVALRAEEALAEARALGERIARGEDPGPLAGLPFGVKDLEDVAGMPTTHGSVPFRQHVAQADSIQVARLRRAGGIPIGKTNTPEFGYTAFTRNRLFGVTRNPWDVSRTPGGSSGGSAAAVASGLVPLATASDGGGSIRIPACYTGAFGLKPTYGRVPRGPLPMREWIDTTCWGPLTRTVTDAALFLDAVAGYDGRDPDSLPPPGVSYVEALDRLPRGLRIAYSATLGYARVEPEVRAAVDEAVGVLARALDRPVELLADRLTDAGFAWAAMNAFELHARLADVVEAHRGDWGRGFLTGVDLGGRITAADMGRFQRERMVVIQEVAAIFSRYDLLLTPTLPTTAFAAKGPLPDTIDGERLASPIHAVAFTYPFNLTGHPAATVRAGLSAEGLPMGLQLIADRGREDLLLAVARVYERVRPFDGWPREPRGTVAG
jgi:Asp-tRNA(Asn)/Glu-tRNA(Gln) amidotransferase A subunit family amidase